MLRRGMMAAGGGGGGSLYSEIMSHSPFMYFTLGESAGTVAANDGTGPDGTYSGSYSLGNAALYSGGPTSYSPTGSSGRAAFPAASIPSFSAGMTLGVVCRSSNVSGLRLLVMRDNAGVGGGSRQWQFRLYSGNLQFEKTVGSYQQVAAAHGLSNGQDFFAAFTYDATSGAAKLFLDGTQLGSTATFETGADFGGSGGSNITVGNFHGYDQAATGDLFSDAFVIAAPLSGADIAAIAAAGGF